MALLLFAGAILLIIVGVAYPYIQDRRERDLARRLEDVHDPQVASAMLDMQSRISQEEAGFFRRVGRWFWLPWWW